MSKILLDACIIIGGNQFIILTTTCHIQVKVARNLVVGMVRLMTMVMFSPIGPSLITLSSKYLSLTSVLHILGLTNMLKLIILPPFLGEPDMLVPEELGPDQAPQATVLDMFIQMPRTRLLRVLY